MSRRATELTARGWSLGGRAGRWVKLRATALLLARSRRGRRGLTGGDHPRDAAALHDEPRLVRLDGHAVVHRRAGLAVARRLRDVDDLADDPARRHDLIA